jgi:hypothetical protein
MTLRLWLLPCVLLLTQCGVIPRIGHSKRGADASKNQADPERRGWGLTMSDEEWAKYKAGAAASTTTSADATPSPAGATPGGEGGAFDFSSMIPGHSTGPTQVIWLRSATQAGSKSRLTGTPLLIYATSTASQPCHDMEATLMASPAFRSLTQESFIPLLVDYSDQDTSRSTLYRELKSRFEFHGYPTLVVTLPDGSEVSRLTGYKKENEKKYLESLQAAVEKAGKMASERRAKLEKGGGYRMWKNKDGNPVFAKLTALDANMGTFTGEWGESFKTFLTRLSPEDQAWIAERRK